MEHDIRVVDGLVLDDPSGAANAQPLDTRTPEQQFEDTARQIALLNELLRNLQR